LSLADLTREAAREAAREELSRPEYDAAQPPLPIRLLGRALGALGELLDAAAAAVPGGRVGLLLLLALLLLFVAVVLTRIGPLARTAQVREPLFAGSAVLTADQHRELAESAARDGRYAEAVRERLRAVVRDLEARGVLDPQPGRTAGEVAREGGAAVPEVAQDLQRAARVFDEVWYGGRPADRSSYALLVDVDTRVARTALAVR
jgi:hypothetical protein